MISTLFGLARFVFLQSSKGNGYVWRTSLSRFTPRPPLTFVSKPLDAFAPRDTSYFFSGAGLDKLQSSGGQVPVQALSLAPREDSGYFDAPAATYPHMDHPYGGEQAYEASLYPQADDFAGHGAGQHFYHSGYAQ